MPSGGNLDAASTVLIPLLVSNFGGRIPKALLQIRIRSEGKVLYRKEVRTGEIPDGGLTRLYALDFRTPSPEKPMKLTLHVSLSGGDTDCENAWDLYVFPKSAAPSEDLLCRKNAVVFDECGPEITPLDRTVKSRTPAA